MMQTFDKYESQVRSYCRSFPTVFEKAQGHLLRDADGREYVDFFSGAGSLNYGHNPPALKEKLLEYLAGDGVTHSLDMATSAKRDFLETFNEVILSPRGMDYKVMFPGPTGTNAVEAALKIARTVTGRNNVIAFTNAFHGMTLGSLALTANGGKRSAAGVALDNVTRMPYHRYMGGDLDTIDFLEHHLKDTSSGVDLPAALVLETVQAEGGVNVASNPWLRRLRNLLRRYGILMIVDDIQVGCGRTGPFFSFEAAGIEPDIICLSKSLSGYGLPFAVTLLDPELDQLGPGKHNGTFRGHNLAFVTATAALNEFWTTEDLTEKVQRDSQVVRSALDELADASPATVRGRGMIYGVEFEDPEMASAVSHKAFENGLILETCGAESEVLKLLPPLTIPAEELRRGLEILAKSTREALAAAGDAVTK